jgi:hypothetical protein
MHHHVGALKSIVLIALARCMMFHLSAAPVDVHSPSLFLSHSTGTPKCRSSVIVERRVS